MYRFVLILVALAVSLFAAQKGETKADSMVYEKGMEWKVLPANGAVKRFCVQKDNLWYITDKGLSFLNMTSAKKNDVKVVANIGSIPSADATCVSTDLTNTLWVGTKNGCAVFVKDAFKIFTKDNGLADNMVNALATDKSGKTWICTDNGASVYQNGEWKTYTSKDGLAGDKVQCIAVAPNGTVWLGTNKGISSFDGAQWASHSMKTGLSWNDTKAIAIDPRNGSVWAAVGDKDINSYNGKEWKVFMEVGEGIIGLMVDTQSRVWISTASGLMKFNGDEWVTDAQKLGITAAAPSQLYRDEKGNLWFGMESGVLKLNNPYPY